MESPSWDIGTQGQPSSTKAGAEHGTLITLHIYTSMSIRPLLILCTSISVASYAVAQQSIPDTLQVKSLPEVAIEAKAQMETPQRALFWPSKLLKTHTTNALELLNVLQIPSLSVTLYPPSISTQLGGSVAICINGREAQLEDLLPLRSSTIQKIEYTRTPTGRYTGRAGLINICTTPLDYGGNIYASLREGFLARQGDYLAYADYTRRSLTLSLTLHHDWKRQHDYTEGSEAFHLHDGTTRERYTTTLGSTQQSDRQAAKLVLAHTGTSSSLSGYIQFLSTGIPREERHSLLNYRDQGSTTQHTSTRARGLSPSLHLDYSLTLPREQTVSLSLDGSYGHHRHSRSYQEDRQQGFATEASEQNLTYTANALYTKTLKGGLSCTLSLMYSTKSYRDSYTGISAGEQSLTTREGMALLQASQAIGNKLYYYASAGLSTMGIKLNHQPTTYLHPVFFYGANYTLSPSHSISLNGQYTHTLFDPSNKNAMTIPISALEVKVGNPYLRPIKVVSNTAAYNGTIGSLGMELAYSSTIYLHNELRHYYSDTRRIYSTRANDGRFYGNMFSLSGTYSLLGKRLTLGGSMTYEYNIIDASRYQLRQHVARLDLSLSYLIGRVYLGANYSAPYTALDAREPLYLHSPSTYGGVIRWHHGAWNIGLTIRNILRQYASTHTYMDYGVYRLDQRRYSQAEGRYIGVTVTYSLGFGRGKQLERPTLDTTLENALMR